MIMSQLFHILPNLPNGFRYFPDFITEAEELELSEMIRHYHLKKVMFRGFEAKRRVANFGYDYHFDSRMVTQGEPLPKELVALCSKVEGKLNISSGEFKAVLVTEYSAGTVINWHRDGPPFEKIAGISLLSDCTFKLRPYDKLKQTRSNVVSFIAERRSLYVMEGEAREEWEHSIAPVKSLRYSVTMRTLRNKI
jgi:alkylated DNA repair dioxygenase AlkB